MTPGLQLTAAMRKRAIRLTIIFHREQARCVHSFLDIRSCMLGKWTLAANKILSSEPTSFASRFGCIACGGNETSCGSNETTCFPDSATGRSSLVRDPQPIDASDDRPPNARRVAARSCEVLRFVTVR